MKTRLIIVLAMLLPAALAGCNVLSPVKNETTLELINKLPENIPQQQAHDATLLLLPPDTSTMYDTTQMAYTIKPYQIEYFSRHEWGATPAQMLLPLLDSTLEGTHYFSAVLTPPYTGSCTYALRTQILELVQDFSSEPATLRLALRVELIDGKSNRLIASRKISLSEPLQEKTPYAGVVAANDATAKALQQIAGFVLEEMK